MSNRVVVTIKENGIAVVTLNRPEKMNAIDLDMFESITAAGESLINNRAVKAVVIHGDGAAFCAGLDLSSLAEDGPDEMALGSPKIGKAPNLYQKVAWVWKEVPVPVIAAVHGVCFGGGLQIALGADMRYVHKDTKMSIMESKWGLIPDMAGTQILRDLCRVDIAKELTFTGRIFNGEQAVQYGIATEVAIDPLAKAMAVAESIVALSPDAMVYAKQLFEDGWQCSREEGLLMEETLNAKLMGSENQMEAVRSGMSKSKGNYKPRMQDAFYQGNWIK
ncbi:crotonase/enoyl-CoA hydratase family protein [Paraglaciecola sp. 20A4]|uniref:crotonase/enoyl-CoA hydratase family protein n=1 Tax=Paraglaciecola sp. 20A4 TaxID=2687288 RepID=UPI00140D0DDF|nr:crotonase/enoyl-CoA hydratase family protein [Paraglaciecola sp. 20A4]